MQQHTAEVLARNNLVGRVTISKTPTSGGWAVSMLGHDGQLLADSLAMIETARGGIRIWKSLDTAQAWVEMVLGGDDRDPTVSVALDW